MQSIPNSLAQLIAPDSPVGEFAARLAHNGHRCYLVGGSVRDAVLGRVHVDLDVATDAHPHAVSAVLKGWADAVWLQGERFGTVGFEKDGAPVEVTTFRAEVYRPESRKPYVEYSDSIETDLSRRDFTVNAMAVSVPDGVVVDPYGGAADLEARVLRTPLSPAVSFTDDPLRMLRAARFTATYGLAPAPELVAAMEEYAERIEIISAERVRDELSKLVVASDPCPGFGLLDSTGLRRHVLPEELDVEHLVGAAHSLVVRLSVLLAPSGGDAARARVRALRFPNDVIDAVARVVAVAQQVEAVDRWSDAAVRRVAVRGGAHFDDVLAVCAARGTGAAFRERVVRLSANEDLTAITVPIDGSDVMARLRLAPGREVGEALAHVMGVRIERGPLDRAAALDALDDWAGGR